MKNGFALCQGKYVYYLESDKKVKCKSVIDAFINALCDRKNICDDLRERILKDEATRQDIFSRVDACQYELRGDNLKYHHFEERYCSMNFPLDDCAEVIFLN